MRLDVGDHDRRGEEIVGRNIEEALDLPGVQIDGQHAVGAGPGDEIGHELGRDRRARPLFAVLPGIAEIGNDRGDAPRRGAPQRVDHDEHFHQMIVGRRGGRLHDESVLPAHILLNLDEDLHIGEAPHLRPAQRNAEIRRDRIRERPIGVARENFHRRHSTLPSPRASGLLAAMGAWNNTTKQ